VNVNRRAVLLKVADMLPPASEVQPQQEHKTGIPTMKPQYAPFEHQEAAARKMEENKGRILVAHEMGTGKTFFSIYAFERLRHKGKANKALVVVPSGLRDNYGKSGVGKFTTSDYQIIGSSSDKKGGNIVGVNKLDPNKPYTIVSYSMFRRNPQAIMDQVGADTLILDEFHKTRNERSKTFKAVMSVRNRFANVMGLTASPINNNPAELATLLTITEGKRLITPAQFERAFVRTVGVAKGFGGGKQKVEDLKNHRQLLHLALPRMDYVASQDLKGKTMPARMVQDVNVPMSDEQWGLYQLALDRLPAIREYLMRRDPNITVKEAEQIFTQLMAARQLSNSIHMGRSDITPTQSAERTPKTKRLLDDAVSHLSEDTQNKVVLYSNLVRGGVDVLVAGLRDRGIEPAIFVGKGTQLGDTKVTGESRQQGVDEYKAGKKRVIVLSGAGAEGLDLKNSTAFYALDKHYNPEVMRQAEARARRLGGQSFRPEEQRQVDVRYYTSTIPESKQPGFFGKLVGRKPVQTTDEWISGVAGRKSKKTQSFQSAMRKPHKYIRKYRTASGRMHYVYPKDTQKKMAMAFLLLGKRLRSSHTQQ
jgi:hypothetical protein